MKYILLILFSPLVFAQSDDYWELYETYAAADAVKYHDILQSIEAGDISKAKEKLLSYQAAEILILEKMKNQKQIHPNSIKVIEMVRKYNQQYEE